MKFGEGCDLSGAARLPLQHPQHGEALGLKHLGIGIHRSPMQKQALPMHLNRPLGISAEQQWILNQISEVCSTSHMGTFQKGQKYAW